MCHEPEEDVRFDAPVDGAYFQRWVVGEDKQLGATICAPMRHPSGDVVGVLQVLGLRIEDKV